MVPKSKCETLLEGDANTKYFHFVANGKHMKNSYVSIRIGRGYSKCDDELKKYITRYYKSPFGSHEPSYVTMDESRT